MINGQGPHHFTPISVGALMDPAFLSAAVRNANGDPAAGASSWPPLPRGVRLVMGALRATAGMLRRR
jgi:hypothetical protein